MCSAGNRVVFVTKGSYAFTKKTSEQIDVLEDAGTCALEMWICTGGKGRYIGPVQRGEEHMQEVGENKSCSRLEPELL